MPRFRRGNFEHWSNERIHDVVMPTCARIHANIQRKARRELIVWTVLAVLLASAGVFFFLLVR